MAWCAGHKYTTEAVSGDDENAEFFRVLQTQLTGHPAPSSPTASRSPKMKLGTSLEFMFLDLNKQSMQILLQGLSECKSVGEIKKIVFHGCRIRDQASLELLGHLFHLYRHWTHVEISCLCQGLGNEQSRVLLMEIMKSKGLEHINISSMAMSDGLIFWRDLLSSPHPASPSSIVMRSSRIAFDHTQDFLSNMALIRPPKQHRHSLKHLDLSACRMDDRALEIVASGLRTMNISLESLILKGNRLSHKSIPAIAQLIRDHEMLKALDLSMNTRLFSGDEPGTEANIDKVIKAAISEDSSSSLEKLFLSKTSVGEKAAISMIKALERNTVLHELDLNFCLLGEKVMEQLVFSLPKMRSLRLLLLHGLHFNQRNAANQPHARRQALWNALQENISLVKIQGLSMFLGAGRPELASEIQNHLSARNRALHEAGSIHADDDNLVIASGKKNLRKRPAPALWPFCLQKLGRGDWSASAIYLFLQNNAGALEKLR